MGSIARSITTNQVLDQLRVHILTNVYENGEQVTEAMLAERYRVNRSSVRNALLVLERESLISVEPNGTKKVSRFTREDANNLYDLRSYIEINAARRFFALPQRNFNYTLEATKNVSLAMSSGDLRSIMQADASFHSSIVHLSGNKAFLQTWIALSGTTQALFLLNINDSPEYRQWYMQTFAERHEALLVALMSEEEKYYTLLTDHIEGARKVSCDVIDRIAQGQLKIKE
jgi:DNA-binding GntR family transcriptional regulator